jgi:uncharacterized protein (DUF4415 family)
MKKSASNTVKLTLDTENLPPLTEQQRAELDEIAAKPDESIDYSDAPMLNEAFWHSDVVEYFKHTGKRYQTKINAVLRAYLEAHKNAPG